MAMSGATLREIAEVLGHTNIQRTLKYAHLVASHTTGVVERMTMHIFGEEPRR
jgi:site-specific recombinase XerD